MVSRKLTILFRTTGVGLLWHANLLESLQEADSMSPTSKSESTVNCDDKTTKPMAKKQKVSLRYVRKRKKSIVTIKQI